MPPFKFADVIYANDVRVIQRRRHLRLALKAAAGLGIGEIVGEKLDRDPAAKLMIECEPNGAHATLTELRLDAVMPYLRPRGKLHGRCNR